MITCLTTLLADANVRTYYGVDSFEVWQWLLMAGFAILVIAFIGFMYFIDSIELQAGTTLLLGVLRVLAFAGLLLFFLNLEKRSEKKLVKRSRVAVMVDTSVSMGLRDSDASAETAALSRIDQVIAEFQQGKLLDELREQHDVVVYRFDEEAKPTEVTSFSKLGSKLSGKERSERAEADRAASLATARSIALASGGLLLASLVFGAIFILMRSNRPTFRFSSWPLLLSVLLLVAAVATMAIANLSSSGTPLLVMLGVREETEQDTANDAEPAESFEASEENAGPETKPEADTDWVRSLVPRGTKTRLNDCIRYMVNKERGGPIAAIVVFSDGNNNDGVSETVAATAARDANIPVHLVGLGSITRPMNVRIADVQAPPRVYPGDDFAIKVLVQSFGMKGKFATLRLSSSGDETRSDGSGPSSTNVVPEPDAAADDAESVQPTILGMLDEVTIELGEDGKEVVHEFEVSPDFQGKRVFTVTVLPPKQDHDKLDNQKSVTVEVVERKNRVLLVAGGPTREFRFLRNQLYRDKDTTLDVYLQTGQPGITQEADNLLFEFPESAEDMFEYDCIVAFDADWRVLDKQQIDLLERWVAEQAGGLIVIAGPVYTPEWTRMPRGDERMDVIRALYPVTFFHQGATTLKLGRFGGEEAFRLKFTREGRAAEFLWLGDTSAKSDATWGQFKGVYGYYAVNQAKKGAQIFAYFSDPQTMSEDGLPIYLAGHFYGAGRVFFQASGEMWRVRAVDDAYFEKYYTQLIHWASQGRLLRDSKRGVLLVDKDRCLLGDHVEVRAILKDAQLEPYQADNVIATLDPPDTDPQELKLLPTPDSTRPGTYSAQFTALRQGTYAVVLAVPEGESLELLTREVEVRAPKKEIERSQRNDPLMSAIAKRTSGKYFVGIDALYKEKTKKSKLPPLIKPNNQETYITGNPDRHFHKLLMIWLLALTCGVLCIEWLIRRLSKLA